jgi:xanthine dehydrogenase large subunit
MNDTRDDAPVERRGTIHEQPAPAHDSARGHVTGAAPYVEDLPRLERELQVDFVPSPVASGRLLSIDASEALRVPGVAGVYTSADVPGHTLFGPILQDEPFLPVDRVSYVGQPVAVVAAETREAARLARRAVRLEIAEEPPVLTIEEADARGLYLGVERSIERGDLAGGWAEATLRIAGSFESGGQEQFYLESQAALAWPGEGREIWIHSSTQNPSEIQGVVAEVLGRGQHQVVCLVRRMGGAFGGKETQAAIPALMAALVVDRTGRPARVVYGKDDDMRSTGKRHPYRTEYRVGCDRRGRITVAELRLRSDGGAFADLSTAVLERSMLHADNAYYLPAVSIRARVCRTNLPPNTAFRGFGGPQGMAVIENVMQEIATRLGLDALDVRRANLYDANLSVESGGREDRARSLTPYGQVVADFRVPEIFDRLERSGRYRERMAAIAAWNAGSKTHLRGLAMTPVKFGISFTTKFMNQANALVQVMTDGTVQVSTGATEMGQGVQTKIAQIVAGELGVDPAAVAVLVTSTEKNANTSPTAASASTDLNGAAAARAAAAIRDRMAAHAASLLSQRFGVSAAAASRPGERAGAPAPSVPGGTVARATVSPDDVRFAGGAVFDARDPERRMRFAELAECARRERVDLGARGFYATPGIDFDRETGRGTPFYYYTTGAAMAQVLIDRLSGDLRVERIDALMDAGDVLNRGIDRGQAIGGLIQGVGWVTTECLVWSDRGELLSHSPTTYKIPNVDDVPAELHLDFLEDVPNRRNVRSTKALGEPPLMLGLAVWAAVHHALTFVTPGEVPPLRLPATHEEILLTIAELERRGAERAAGVAAAHSKLAK